METAKCVLICLVSACLWGTSCTGSIELCTENSAGFTNGTIIPARLGEPVSVVLCVQCQQCLKISSYIQIKHPNHPTHYDYYYASNKDVWRHIIVNITPSANKATINITIKAVQNKDFTDQFYVEIHTDKGAGDKSVFSFHLRNPATSDTTASDAALTLSTQSMMPAVRSISTTPAPSSTELSTVSSQASTAPTSTVTPETAQCRPHKTSQCPENWYQVDNETCLLVTYISNDSLPGTVCNKQGSKSVKKQDITKLNSCLLKILGESKGASHNYVVRINGQFYVNIQTGIQATDKEPYSVVCTKRTSDFSATTKPIDHAVTTPSGSNKSPTISLFTLNMVNRPPRSLVDNITNYFIVSGTLVYPVLTCEAEGVPKPRVVITDESGNQVSSGTWFILAVCSRAEVYTCTASNFLGTSQAHRRIRMLSRPSVKFTASNNNRAVIRSGDIVDLTCSVDGCPDRVTIIKNASPIAETANYTIPFVQNIKEVTCSHMGTYTCLAKYPIDKDVQETADLEVKGCPVSLCESEKASREMSPIIGANVTFTLCLMSSEGLKYSVNDTKIVVKFTRNPVTHRFYWTANITMCNIQVEDYKTHTVMIENSDGSLYVHFTLTDEDSDKTPAGQKAQGQGAESSVLLIALPPVCFIILVLVIVGIVWYRVKGTRISKTRSEEAIDHGSGNDDSGEAMYANVKDTAVGRVRQEPEAEHQQEIDRIQCQEESNTIDLYDQESGRFITNDGLVYITVVNANKEINKQSQRGKHPSKQKCDDGGRVEYLTLDFEKTGKLLVADEEGNKDDDAGDKNDTQQ